MYKLKQIYNEINLIPSKLSGENIDRLVRNIDWDYINYSNDGIYINYQEKFSHLLNKGGWGWKNDDNGMLFKKFINGLPTKEKKEIYDLLTTIIKEIPQSIIRNG